ncbi:MAG: hypothetical protein V7784_22040 [Oceanospirillaceae bacterium]
MSQNSTNKTNKPRANSFFEYLSPFGVISTREFIYRLVSFLGLLLFFCVVAVPLISIIPSYFETAQNQSNIDLLFFSAGISIVMLLWFLLATITKEYRTYGMPIPFIFALATPLIPLLFFIRYFFSSKIERQINTERALEQQLFREAEKELARKKKQPIRD